MWSQLVPEERATPGPPIPDSQQGDEIDGERTQEFEHDDPATGPRNKHQFPSSNDDNKAKVQGIGKRPAVPPPPPRSLGKDANTRPQRKPPVPPPPAPVPPPDISRKPQTLSTLATPTGKQVEDRLEKATGTPASFQLPPSDNRLLETPSDVSSTRQSKFVFLSDQENVPSDLKKFQASATKRRRDLTARTHELDCQIAKIVSQYAQEEMDMSLATVDSLERVVHRPLEASVERLVMTREASNSRGPAVRSLERRVMDLDKKMIQHNYATMSDVVRDNMDALHNDLHQEIMPGMRIENSKSDKIEGGIIRRYEGVAGNMARNFHQEAATRRSTLEETKEMVQAAAQKEIKRSDDVLHTIQELRQRIRQEKREREAADQRIREEIANTTMAMKRAFLAAVGGGV